MFHAHEGLFQTGWFVESVLSASLIVLVVRTRRVFYRSRPGAWLLRATVLVALLVLALLVLALLVLALLAQWRGYSASCPCRWRSTGPS